MTRNMARRFPMKEVPAGPTRDPAEVLAAGAYVFWRDRHARALEPRRAPGTSLLDAPAPQV